MNEQQQKPDIIVIAVFPTNNPMRGANYEAVREGHQRGLPIGRGDTPADAIADLRDQET